MLKHFFLLFILCCFFSTTQAQDTLLTGSGLRYVKIKEGTGLRPNKAQKIKVSYTGRLENGKVFDASPPDNPIKFTLGAHEVIPGWDEGFALMHEGEKGVLIIPANLGYGHRGVPDEDNPGKYIIPPDALLIFEVELISIK